MKDQFIPYEHAKMMKELGFEFQDDDDLQEIRNSIPHPAYQQVEEWLWEKHEINIEIEGSGFKQFQYNIFKNDERQVYYELSICDSPITAHREGILKAIEYIHQQSK